MNDTFCCSILSHIPIDNILDISYCLLTEIFSNSGLSPVSKKVENHWKTPHIHNRDNKEYLWNILFSNHFCGSVSVFF